MFTGVKVKAVVSRDPGGYTRGVIKITAVKTSASFILVFN